MADGLFRKYWQILDFSMGDNLFYAAPMMRHSHHFGRLLWHYLNPEVRLFTEMVSVDAVLHAPRSIFAADWPHSGWVAFQLGGCEPEKLAQAARNLEGLKLAQINLNCGCPSKRVAQNNKAAFGAALMRDPGLIQECVSALVGNTKVPVTVKCRTGVDDLDDNEHLLKIAQAVRSAGAGGLILHARKALLGGLRAKDNLRVPPLNYQRAYWLKQQLGDFPIVINGQISEYAELKHFASYFDGVMLGRVLINRPLFLVTLQSNQASLGSLGLACKFSRVHQLLNALLDDYHALIAQAEQSNLFAAKEIDKLQISQWKLLRSSLLTLFYDIKGARAARQLLANCQSIDDYERILMDLPDFEFAVSIKNVA